jgi:hypothetical protein
MGWSSSQAASRTMDAIEQACRKQQAALGNPSSNVFFVGDRRYFYEVTRRDQPDGGICGSIQLCVGEGYARQVGTFRIDGQGRIVRGPAFFKRAVTAVTAR